jgi:hypothetical protein
MKHLAGGVTTKEADTGNMLNLGAFIFVKA